MNHGLSHITLIVSDLDQTQEMLEQVFAARCVYASGTQQFSTMEERFFLIGEVWLATMQGAALATRSYNHIAFQVDAAELEQRRRRVLALGLEIRPPRSRVQGEGQSLYFWGPDNHLFELHTGTLKERLARYAKGMAYPLAPHPPSG